MEALMRKLLLLLAAAVALGLGKRAGGEASKGRDGTGGGVGLGALLPMLLAPRWMRPLMAARALRRGRR
jgi:hypothetical protein